MVTNVYIGDTVKANDELWDWLDVATKKYAADQVCVIYYYYLLKPPKRRAI
jgi:hypothetical protein